eukprot:gene15854-21483_t
MGAASAIPLSDIDVDQVGNFLRSIEDPIYSNIYRNILAEHKVDGQMLVEKCTSERELSTYLSSIGIVDENHQNRFFHFIEKASNREDARPSWLSASGPGQKNVDPRKWSMTICQWIFFVRQCVHTATWRRLASTKNEYEINMYDLVEHFVIPWTKGTGSSVALLMNAIPAEAELMISHAWGGSVIETYNALQYMVNHCKVPGTAKIFFCALCLYQPEDNHIDGLTIPEQLELKPFAQIIESKPNYGMWVMHTRGYEVYSRMWTVHEVDEAIIANIPIQGAFDFYVYRPSKEHLQMNTMKAECRDVDRQMLTELVESRGGFQRLDVVISKFRHEMLSSFNAFLERNKHDETPDYAKSNMGRSLDTQFDWTMGYMADNAWDGCSLAYESWWAQWAYEDLWYHMMRNQNLHNCEALPLGIVSYPFGKPYYRGTDDTYAPCKTHVLWPASLYF